MEERSPGSYRLSIRGSLLRSPFGVRNVKVYLNDLPFTDASGNTYINLIDPSQFQDVEILKGPDGSLFGANSGGVVLLNTDSPPRDSLTLQANASGGSYGLFREHIRVHHTSKRMEWNFGEAFQRADGYRQQSFMKRLNLLGSGKFRYGKQNSVKLFGLYSDLQYETPGGLTKEQFETDPQQARPGTTEQQTGIYNETLFGGMTNEIVFAGSFRHIVSVFGTSTSFKNPFITNFEIRREKNAGIRSFLEYAFLKKTVELRWYAGLEGQWGNQDISNYENNSGKPGALQASDKIGIGQVFYFTRLTLDVDSKLTIQASVSLNQSTYSFKGFNDKNLSNEWMPRIAASYLFFPELALRASVSRGYSPPTVAEIRPSGASINEMLQAESGWSREIGIRFSQWNDRLQLDASFFRYDLQDAITRRTDENDVEYFLNAGSTKQTGFESLLHVGLVPSRSSGFVQRLSCRLSYTYSHFLFDTYQNGDADFSGNWLTGVPKNIAAVGVTVKFPLDIELFFQSTMVSKIPLNDANTEYAEHYELLQAWIGWKGIQSKNIQLELFAGTDNILNQHYSLGNDINAFGGRYYNAAPLRNFYAGLNIRFK
jgi:iron complex outermembrane receptor protein